MESFVDKMSSRFLIEFAFQIQAHDLEEKLTVPELLKIGCWWNYHLFYRHQTTQKAFLSFFEAHILR